MSTYPCMPQIELLTKEDKAKELKISVRTLTNWIRKDKIEWFIIPKNYRKYFLPDISEL